MEDIQLIHLFRNSETSFTDEILKKFQVLFIVVCLLLILRNIRFIFFLNLISFKSIFNSRILFKQIS